MNPEIVLGPPGTGKTTYLLSLVEEALAAGTPPDRIGFFSFTRRAAQEAIDRACAKFGLQRRDLRFFRTLHSMCFQSLGLSNSDVMEGRKLEEFGDWIGVKITGIFNMSEGSSFGYEPGDRALFMENLARVRCVPLREQYGALGGDDLPWALVDRVQRGLLQWKRDHRLLDYTDMLERYAASEWGPQLDLLLLDEGQDQSELQWRVVRKLARRAKRTVVAGDDDQAIFNWAGAATEFFVAMPGQVKVLGQSHRVPVAVQGVANEVIRRVRMRRPKDWAPRAEAGAVVRHRALRDIPVSVEDTTLILTRNNFLLKEVADHLRSLGVYYEWGDKTSIRPAVLEAVRTWEALRRGEPVGVEEARQVYDLMSSGVGVERGYKSLPGFSGSVTMADLRTKGGLLRDDIWHEALDRIEQQERLYMVRARQRGEKLNERPRVRLSTIHGAKGGEADHVVLLRDMAPRTWQEMHANREDEARVWYVGVTRARRQLSVVAPSGRTQYDV